MTATPSGLTLTAAPLLPLAKARALSDLRHVTYDARHRCFYGSGVTRALIVGGQAQQSLVCAISLDEGVEDVTVTMPENGAWNLALVGGDTLFACNSKSRLMMMRLPGLTDMVSLPTPAQASLALMFAFPNHLLVRGATPDASSYFYDTRGSMLHHWPGPASHEETETEAEQPAAVGPDSCAGVLLCSAGLYRDPEKIALDYNDREFTCVRASFPDTLRARLSGSTLIQGPETTGASVKYEVMFERQPMCLFTCVEPAWRVYLVVTNDQTAQLRFHMPDDTFTTAASLPLYPPPNPLQASYTANWACWDHTTQRITVGAHTRAAWNKHVVVQLQVSFPRWSDRSHALFPPVLRASVRALLLLYEHREGDAPGPAGSGEGGASSSLSGLQNLPRELLYDVFASLW